MAKDDLEFRVVATDDATKVIDSVQKKADKLEGTEADVQLGAKDEASDRIDEVLKRVAGLDGDTAEVILKAEQTKAEGEIRKLQRLLADLDGEEADVVIEARDNATARLAKIKTALDEIDHADVDVEVGGLDKMSGLLDKMPGKAGELASSLGSLGTGGAIAAGVGGVATLLFQAGQEAAQAATEAQSLGKYIGTSTEEASRLLTVLETVGVEAGDLKDIVGQVNGVMTQTPALAEELGIKLEGANPAQVFLDTYDAIRKIEDPQRRLILMGQAFGEEGARQIGEVVARYGDLRKAMEDVNDSQVITDEDAAKAREYEAAMAKVTGEFKGLALTLGQDVLPILTAVADILGAIGTPGPQPGSMDQFVETFRKANTTFEEAQTRLTDMGFAAGDVAAALENAGLKHDDAGQKAKSLADQMGETARETRKAGTAAAQTGRDTEHLGIEMQDAQNPVKTLTTRIEEQTKAYDILKGRYNDRSTFLSITQQFADFTKAVEDNKTAADDAKISNAEFEQQVISLKGNVIDYIQATDDIPPEVKTRLQASVDQGSVEHAQAVLNALTVGRTVDIGINLHPQGSGKFQFVAAAQGSKGLPGGATLVGEDGPELLNLPRGTTVTSAPQTARILSQPSVVNSTTIVNVPRGYRTLDAATAAHRLERRSGRLYKGRGA
jgi:hypothetical protein